MAATIVRQNICFVLPSFAGGGAERVMVSLANGLATDSYEVHILLLFGEGPLRKSVADHIQIHDLQQPRLSRALFSLRKIIKEIQPDILISTMGYLNLSVLLLCATLVSPPKVIVREANTVASTLRRLRYRLLAKIGYKLLYRRAYYILCNAEHVYSELCSLLPVDSRITILPNPVNSEYICKSAQECFKKNVVQPYFVSIGRITEQKGYERLLRCFSLVTEPCNLVIIGEGPLKDNLLKSCEDLGILDRVFFTGFLENPWAVLARSRGLVMTSLWEGFPNVALEALACGVPVLGLETVCGLRELQTQTISGAVALYESEVDLANGLSKSIKHPVDFSGLISLPPQYAIQSVNEKFQFLLRN